MKTFEEWCPYKNPKRIKYKYECLEEAFEAGQANAIDLTEDEWEELIRGIGRGREIAINKLITQALALRERQK